MISTVVLATLTVGLVALCVVMAHSNLLEERAPRAHGVGLAPVSGGETQARRAAIASALRMALRREVVPDFEANGQMGRFQMEGGVQGRFQILRESCTNDHYLVELETGAPASKERDAA
ncbi:MAG: hypothetical protein AB1405_18005 [Bdellovibrionota bacterium]